MKKNPRRIPRSEADVRRAVRDGVDAGIANATAIFLTVLLDKFSMEEQIQSVWAEICKLSEEVGERRVSLEDLKQVLLTEYEIQL